MQELLLHTLHVVLVIEQQLTNSEREMLAPIRIIFMASASGSEVSTNGLVAFDSYSMPTLMLRTPPLVKKKLKNTTCACLVKEIDVQLSPPLQYLGCVAPLQFS